MNIYEKMLEILKNEPCQRHSYFQLKYFNIGKEPTNQSKMWQCLRELKARKDSLDAMQLEYDDTKDKIELLDITLEELITESSKNSFENLQTKKIEIQIRQNKRYRNSLEKTLQELEEKQIWTTQEIVFFIDTFQSLEKIEPLKNFDDFESQKHYWNEKLTNKYNLKMLNSGQVDTELLETIMALPDDVEIKQKTIQTLQLRQQMILKQIQENRRN